MQSNQYETPFGGPMMSMDPSLIEALRNAVKTDAVEVVPVEGGWMGRYLRGVPM